MVDLQGDVAGPDRAHGTACIDASSDDRDGHLLATALVPFDVTKSRWGKTTMLFGRGRRIRRLGCLAGDHRDAGDGKSDQRGLGQGAAGPASRAGE